MPKNIVICLDGTGNQLRAGGNTNVVRTFQLLDLDDASRQIAYYDPGVGTFSATGTWLPWTRALSRLTGLAFGTGLRTNVSEAYRFLMEQYEAGDAIFLFGFSRGAYSARALAGLLSAVGLLRAGSENLVPYAVATYARNKEWSDADWKLLHEFAASFSRVVNGKVSIPVAYVGVWDTVKAAGFLRWGDLHWLYTRQLPDVARVRHAMSIDEKRRPYREYAVTPKPGAHQPALEQAWFAGVHSDVGGTFDDDPRLPRIALKWLVDGALEAGLVVRKGGYRKLCAVTPDCAQGDVHKMGSPWRLLGTRRRSIAADDACHASVRDRIAADPAYNQDQHIPPTVRYVDEDWLTPRA